MTATRRRRFLNFSFREIALIIFITFPVMGTLFPLDSYLSFALGGVAGVVSKSPFNTTIVLGISLVFIVALYAQSPAKAGQALRANWLLFVFILWSFVTSRWAADSGYSFNRSGRMLVFALYAIYLINFIEYRRALQLLVVCLTISCLVSLLLIAVAPSLSYTVDFRGAWRGAMLHKNALGSTAAMTFLIAIAARRIRLFSGYYVAGLLVMSTLLLLLANSATALLSCFLVSGVLFFFSNVVNRVRHPFFMLFFTGFVGLGLAYLVVQSEILFTVLQRDASLTGRDDVWVLANYLIGQKPFWGWGMGAWGDANFQDFVLRELKWAAPHAHNAWLDIRLQLGLPGLVLAIAIWAVAVLHIFYAVAKRRLPEMALPIGIFLVQSIRTYSETIVVDPALNDMFWLAFAFASLTALPSMERKRRQAAASSPLRTTFRLPPIPGRAGEKVEI